MATTTILHEYERRLEMRLAQGEITENTRNTYLNDASRVCEVLLSSIPVPAIEGYMAAAGYLGDYGTVIEGLCELAREPRRISFVESGAARRRRSPDEGRDQQALPGI